MAWKTTPPLPFPAARRPWPAIALLAGAVLVWNVGEAAAQSGPVDQRTAAQFLEAATFGPTAADIAAVQTLGLNGWVQQQFATGESAMPDDLDVNQVRSRLFLNMANGPDQLRQRAMFALSQTIVVSANKNGNGYELIPWVRLLSRNAFGNYRTLLHEVTLSPTMGKYLDMAYSRKASATSSPNENYPRELLQLFTIGLWELNQDGTPRLDGQGQPIPTYSQTTLREFARALTGWTFPTQPGATPANSNPQYFVGQMESRTATHDFGAKTLFGGVVLPANQSPAADVDGVIDNIFAHPNVPPFVATRLIRSLVTSNPSPAYIRRVANAFANDGAGVRGDMRAVLTAVLTDPEALSFVAPQDGRLKDPVLHLIGIGRALGAVISDPSAFMYLFSNLNERPLTPTTVFSFYSPLTPLPGHTDLFGPEFQIYPPALAIQRANAIYSILNGQFDSSFRVDLAPYVALAGNVPALIARVNQTLMHGRMSVELSDLIASATNAVPATDTRQRALGALYLAAISSEYSVHSSSTTASGTTTLQPPTGLSVASIIGNVVTLRWSAPAIGPAPTGYVFEGGVHPGEVLASMATGTAAPGFSFAAPPGSFYVRVHSVAGAARSRASSEIRIHVEQPVGPTAPANLLGVVNGSSLGLTWRNTFSGGAPTGLRLDVTGAITASLPLPVSESFSFSGVPAGTYTFSVRATNQAGSSGSSNSVTLTFPSKCSGTPQPPLNFLAVANGRTVSLAWNAAASGPASLGYLVNVTGPFTGAVPTANRLISGIVAPGTYTFSVRAVNPCGQSAATAAQSIVVR